MKAENNEKPVRKKHGGLFWLIMLVITCALTVCCAGVITVLYELGMYDSTARFEKSVNDHLLKSYAVYALEDYRDDFRLDKLENSNFQYAVYTTEDHAPVDLSRRSTYLVCTLPDEDLKGNMNDLFTYSATLGEYSYFEYNIDSLLNSYSYITNNGSYSRRADSLNVPISRVVYVWNTNTVYVICGEYYLPVEATLTKIDGSDWSDLGEFVNSTRDGWTKETLNAKLTLFGNGEAYYDIDDVDVVAPGDLVGFTSYTQVEDWGLDLTNWSAWILKYPEEDPAYGQDFYLIAKVREPLNTQSQDLFTVAAPYIDLAISLRYLPFVAGAIFGLLFLYCLVKYLACFFRWIGRVWKWCSHQWHGHVRLMWRAIFICAACTLAELIVLAFAYHEGDDELIIFGWFVQTIVLVPLFIFSVLQLRKLADGARRMSSGDLSRPIDTSHMIYDFKTLGDSMNTARDGLERAVDARMKSERFKTELISNVSHDIKTPLTSIISYVELLKDQPENEPANREYLDTLGRQSVKLKKLLEDLIEASKASTGNLKAELSPCNVNTVLYQVIGEYEEKLSAAQIDLRIKVPDEQINIMADTQHLQRVFDNLLTNISKYAQPGTRAYINLNAGSDNVVIEMKNTSKEPLNMTSDELLERFTRGDSSRGSEGNGLGLNISQSLVELMKGKLRLEIDGDLFKILMIFPRVADNLPDAS